jgi:Icc protein
MCSDIVKLIHITDPHIYGEPRARLKGCDTRASLLRIIAHIKRHPPADMIVATGDLAHDGSPRAYEFLTRQLQTLDAPVYWIPGNHDVPANMSAMLRAGNVARVSHIRHANWQIIFLDSSVAGMESGRVADAELKALDSLLATQRQHHALVCVHHPPFAVGSAWIDSMMIENTDALLDVLHRHHHVRAVLCGHVHQAYDEMRDGIRLITSPSTCVQFLPGAADFALDDRPPGYRWLELDTAGRIHSDIVWL